MRVCAAARPSAGAPCEVHARSGADGDGDQGGARRGGVSRPVRLRPAQSLRRRRTATATSCRTQCWSRSNGSFPSAVRRGATIAASLSIQPPRPGVAGRGTRCRTRSPTSCSCTAVSSMDRDGRASTTCSPPTGTESASSRTRPCRSKEMPQRRASSSTTGRAGRSSSDTPTAEPSSPRPAPTSASQLSSMSRDSPPTQANRSNTLIAGFPTDGPQPPILPPDQGFLFLDREKFPQSFAGDVPAQQAAFLADAQVPWGVDALGGHYHQGRVAEQAELVPPHDRRPDDSPRRATYDVRAGRVDRGRREGSHAVYVSQPGLVADLVKQAATAAAAHTA